MERHVFSADYIRCQVRRQPQLRAETNHTGRLLHIVIQNTCVPCSCLLQVKSVLAVCVWRKFYFCCGTAVSCYMCDVNYSVFVLLRILFLYICMPGVFHPAEKDTTPRGCGAQIRYIYYSVTVFFISSWKLKFLACLLNVHNVSL
jgi:hypothetical protein